MKTEREKRLAKERQYRKNRHEDYQHKQGYILNNKDKPDSVLAEELDESLYYVWLVQEVERNEDLQPRRNRQPRR